MAGPRRGAARAARRLAPLLALLLPAGAPGAEVPAALPSFEQLQEAGATVGEVRIVTDNIFDENDPKENNVLFRAANTLHIRTRPSVIESTLLFKPGDPLSVRLIEESERLLRDNRYLYDVKITPVGWHDGVVDIEVRTRDTWTLDPGVSVGRSGGVNTGSVQLKEYNLFGTGTSVGLSRRKDADRTSTIFDVSHNHLFDGWTAVRYSHSNLEDGSGQSFGVERPFYALDTRWAAGVSFDERDQVDSVYNAGDVIAEYRHRSRNAQAYGGWSQGLIDGWTQRYSVGLTYRDDAYEREPGLTPPPRLPEDATLAGPFLRYEVIEDGYERFKNRNQIERPEYFQTGFNSSLQIGRALQGLGSTRDAWLYSASIGDGVVPHLDHILVASAALSGQYSEGQAEHLRGSGMLQYYVPQAHRFLFFASATLDAVHNEDVSELLMIGGDSGLRGYPLRYQTGERRALFTIEERGYTDWYPLRLFRVGGAVFFDVGRAWGGDFVNTANPGWLKDVGFGLRLLSARSAFGNILHADVAFPLDGDPNIKSVQFLLKTKTSF
jgi:outer membrane protein assembly factor BamA